MFLPTEHASNFSIISVGGYVRHTRYITCGVLFSARLSFLRQDVNVTIIIASYRLFFLAFGLRFIYVSFDTYVAFVPM